jgi:hypothetical protein
MFKKHIYTCPDVIYLRNRQKKINHITIGVNLIFFGALWLYGARAERAVENAIDEHENTNP